MDACCAVPGNDCLHDGGSHCNGNGCDGCVDRTSSSDWLFGLWPGPPQRFEPIRAGTYYQNVVAGTWPAWGDNGELNIGGSGAPGGSDGYCNQGYTYRGTRGEICGGDGNWGATDVEVWYPR